MLLVWGAAPHNTKAAVFDVKTRARLLTLPDDKGHSGPLAISPDGRTVALVSDQKKVVLWDQGLRAFSPLVALSGYGVGSIQILDGALSRSFADKLRRPGGSEDPTTTGLAFSPDGLTLASMSDQTILLWDFDVTSWRRRACAIANRNLTHEEWDRYIGAETYRKTCGNIP